MIEEKSVMFVIRRLIRDELDAIMESSVTQTEHFISKRLERYQAYLELGLLDDKRFIEGFLVDKEHPDGNELHCITRSAIIFIFNENTLRLITIKGARGGQIVRYYKELEQKIPLYMKPVINMAYEREKTNPIHEI